MNKNHHVLVLDFGSQYTQLIARRIREKGVYSEIKPHNISLVEIRERNPAAIILSGGPSSVYDEKPPKVDPSLFDLDIPILGICYGLQLMAINLGGTVEPAAKREYGRADLQILTKDGLFEGIPDNSSVWMSHGDHITAPPPGFETTARTANAPVAAISNRGKQIFGIQFHPEVMHTEFGSTMLSNFLFKIAEIQKDWSHQSYLEQTIGDIRNRVGDDEVICGVSGGVDSTVLAVLLKKSIGNRLVAVFVDTGLLRQNEVESVRTAFESSLGISLRIVNGSEIFLGRLAGKSDPEQKRKIIGRTFIELFEKEAACYSSARFLAQGTLYPDVIESQSTFGPSAHIKTHHNVGGLPERMNLELIEPLRELFKDEVREIGGLLGIPAELLNRHPFPGPGLAVRIIGEIDRERLSMLRLADEIFISELQANRLYDEVWQAFAVLLPVKTVGVMGDGRTYENVIALRAVTSVDGMTADWAQLPGSFLAKVSNRIINEVKGINRVVYDVSSKPPGTIEWE